MNFITADMEKLTGFALRLYERMTELGYNPNSLGNLLKKRYNKGAQQTINAIFARNSQTSQMARELAEILKVNLDWLMTGRGEKEIRPELEAQKSSRVSLSEFIPGSRPPPLPGHTLVRVIPIHGSVSAANGTIYGLAEPDGSRKLYLDVPEDCYAVEVSGDSMEPRYQHGDKVLIHPAQTITKGMDVLIRLPDGEGMIKTFVGEKAGVITYRQYSPKEQDKTIKRADIEGMHAVICRWG